jgi:hypothetical protein
MKGYTSLSSSPTTNYMRFNDNSAGSAGGGRGRSRGGGIVGSPGSLGGLGDNIGFKRFETYISNEVQQKREINQKSGTLNENTNLYTTENIIQINDNNNNNNNKNSSNKNISNNKDNEPFVAGEVVYRTVVIPFYICLMDIVILNDLFIEVVDNGSIETKNKVLTSGKLRKYRLNGGIKNYDIFIEMDNEDVFHVKKRGIMMRVRVSEELRQLIINTMVNYVADGEDLDPKSKSKSRAGSGGAGAGAGEDASSLSPVNTRNGVGRSSGVLSCFGCFTSRHD